ncbi:hypothetical protein ACFFSY_17955 [Paenibacillus aurantiacus]|uniref:Copper amine oxidase-like N-terminal domain-containing protein n=1 Tax=Paenibacillus aurantiacus TaxID=1936118 RepID=A0ABV5KRG8_9BACL
MLQSTPAELNQSETNKIRWSKAKVFWSSIAFQSAELNPYGLSVLYENGPASQIVHPFALIIRPDKSDVPLPDLGGATADMDITDISRLKPTSKVEKTWVGKRENEAQKITFVSGKLSISYISTSSQGDAPFYYVRFDEAYLSQGQYANMRVYGKDHAFELLDQRINGFKNSFRYTGIVDDGNYSFLSFIDDVGETQGYIVDRETGNVYDNISGGIVDNLYMIDTMQILTPDEMISILKREPASEGYDIQFYGNEHGMYLLDYVKDGMLVTRYKGDPVSGDILENIPNRSMIDNVRNAAIMYKLQPLIVTYEIDPNVQDFENEEAIIFTPNNVAVQAFSEIILKPKVPNTPYLFLSGDTLSNSNVLSEILNDGTTFKLKAKSGSFGEATFELHMADSPIMKGKLHVKVILNHTKRWEK